MKYECHHFPFKYRPSAVSAALFVLSIVGCGTTQQQASSRTAKEVPRALIARPCVPLQQKAVTGAPVAMLVQVASISSPIEQPLRPWLDHHAVETHNLAGILVEQGTPAIAPWGECVDAGCSALREAKLRVHVQSLPANSSAPAVLEVEIESPNAAPKRAIVQAGNQAPTLADLTSAAGESIVVTPYYLFDPKKDSLDLLHACISRDAEHKR
ncbi:MAG TPA: hypothetical protein VK550_26800 [Polyangiaceae bacterium]|nr:hypothetical protein [Polyangiaceae bacterium]